MTANEPKIVHTISMIDKRCTRMGFEPATPAMSVFRDSNLNFKFFSILMRSPSLFRVKVLLVKSYVTVILCFCSYS
jgi:hypothetical protein